MINCECSRKITNWVHFQYRAKIHNLLQKVMMRKREDKMEAWRRKVLDEAICAGSSPSHDIRPPWPSSCTLLARPNVTQDTDKRTTGCAWITEFEPKASFQLPEFSIPARITWSFLVPHNPFNCPLNPRPFLSSRKLGKVLVWVSTVHVQHIWSVKTVMVMAGGTCGAGLSPLNWRVCAGLTDHYMGEGA